ISGLRSRKAWARPVALALTPGPSVESTAPGAPVSSPVTAAIMHAELSWWQSTKGSSAARAASRTSRLEPPPGTPKIRDTPARRSPSTRRSATVGIRTPAGSGWQWRSRSPHHRSRTLRLHGLEVVHRDEELASETSENRAHPVEGLRDVRLGVGVGKPEIALAVLAESGATQHGDAAVFENGLRHLTGRLAQPLDVGEHVEGALGRAATHSGQGVESRHDEIAPSFELGDHLAHRHLVSLQRGNARPLREGGGAGVRV